MRGDDDRLWEELGAHQDIALIDGLAGGVVDADDLFIEDEALELRSVLDALQGFLAGGIAAWSGDGEGLGIDADGEDFGAFDADRSSVLRTSASSRENPAA